MVGALLKRSPHGASVTRDIITAARFIIQVLFASRKGG